MKNTIKIFIICLIIIFIVIIYIVLSNMQSSFTRQQMQYAVPTPIAAVENSLPLSFKNIFIGQTREEEILRLPNLAGKNTLANGYTEYALKIEGRIRPNSIVVKNGFVISKRERLEAPPDSQLPTVSYFLSQYGNPEQKIKGSAYYGRDAVYFIYAGRGVAFVANEYTGQVFEIQFFRPVSLDEYIKVYGSDVGNPPPVQF